jgi:Transposase domain (DUF772)
MGRPSIDPELMIRMLIIGYCFGIRIKSVMGQLEKHGKGAPQQKRLKWRALDQPRAYKSGSGTKLPSDRHRRIS